jgi:hypothetical protein
LPEATESELSRPSAESDILNYAVNPQTTTAEHNSSSGSGQDKVGLKHKRYRKAMGQKRMRGGCNGTKNQCREGIKERTERKKEVDR